MVKPGGVVEGMLLAVVICCGLVHSDEIRWFGMYESQNIQSLNIDFRNINSLSRLGIVSDRETGMVFKNRMTHPVTTRIEMTLI
jgi:hypothetical protein